MRWPARPKPNERSARLDARPLAFLGRRGRGGSAAAGRLRRHDQARPARRRRAGHRQTAAGALRGQLRRRAAARAGDAAAASLQECYRCRHPADQPSRHSPARRGRRDHAAAGAAGRGLFRRHGRRSGIEEPSTVPTPGHGQRGRAAGQAAGGRRCVFDVQPGPRYLFGRSTSTSSRTAPGSRRRARPASAWSRASRRGPSSCSMPSRSCSRMRARRASRSAALQDRDAIVDHDTRRMDVTLKLEPGQRAEFGAGHLHRWRRDRLRLPARPRADQGGATLQSDPGRRRPEAAVRHQPVLDHRHPSGHAADGRRIGSTSPMS